jgi:uncharacterized protein YcbX
MKADKTELGVTIVELIVYPIKGCGGLSLSTAKVSQFGLVHDRAWTLLGDDNTLLTSKTHPKLAELDFSVEGDDVFVAAPGFSKISLKSLHASEWFTDLLEMPCCLTLNDLSSSVDHQPISLITVPSLVALNGMISIPFKRLRFKANLVVDGDCAAFEEASWQTMHTSELHLLNEGECVRPHMFVQELPWLSSLSEAQQIARTKITASSQNLIFGKYLSVRGDGLLSVKDRLLAA